MGVPWCRNWKEARKGTYKSHQQELIVDRFFCIQVNYELFPEGGNRCTLLGRKFLGLKYLTDLYSDEWKGGTAMYLQSQ